MALLSRQFRGPQDQVSRNMHRSEAQRSYQGSKEKDVPSKSHIRAFAVYDAKTKFLKRYIELLVSELVPTANYQCHITALKELTFMLQSGIDNRIESHHLSKIGSDQVKWPFSLHVSSPELVRLLVDLVLDPFDDVRAASAALLPMLPLEDLLPPDHMEENEHSDNPNTQSLDLVLERAKALASSTFRADHADGTARLYELRYFVATQNANNMEKGSFSPISIIDKILFTLESVLAGSAEMTYNGVDTIPMHGYLSALR